MSNQSWFNQNLGYDRNVLRNCKKKIELDIKGIHPRQIVRDIRKKIETIKNSNDSYLFEILLDTIQIDREEFGQSLGIAKGGLVARHEQHEHNMGTTTIKPFKHLSNNLFGLGAILAFLLMLVEPILIMVYLPLLYFAVIFGRVEAEVVFPMTFSDDVYCLIEGELIEDTEHNVDSNISLIVAGVNYCSFWNMGEYLNHFKHNFQLKQENIVSKSISNSLFVMGNIMEQNTYPQVICDKIDEIQKNILIHIFLKHEDTIKRNSKTPVLLSKKYNLNQMTSSQISNELAKYLETNLDLGKYLNAVILNQEISKMIKLTKSTFKYNPVNYDETEINNIIEKICLLYSGEKPKMTINKNDKVGTFSSQLKIENLIY
jgi:hypothetical protein